MFNIGDLIIYSTHGICQIDDICEKTYTDVTRTYYVLHPLEGNPLTINIPVDNNKALTELILKDEAEDILESFKHPGAEWIEKSTQRPQVYLDMVKTGNRKEISQIVNTLMRKKMEADLHEKKFPYRDTKLLSSIQKILFKEMAISLNTSFEDICNKATKLIKSN